MKKFAFLGYYNKKEEIVLNSDWEVIEVPFKDDKNKFQYGIERTLQNLLSYGIVPTEEGLDVLSLATLVYLADTRVSRIEDSQDSWTREFMLYIPVMNTSIWIIAKESIQKMLNFLTGDRWIIEFVQRDNKMEDIIQDRIVSEEQQIFDVVSLFSGGMDSLISTINFLQEGKKPLLISHAGEGLTKNVQQNIIESLNSAYEKTKPVQLNLWMVFKKNFIPQSESENTTRSRSFLFIGLGIFTISGMKEIRKLEVPENGLIALNVPLDNLRVGSHSTRTTHPYYLGLWNTILQTINLNITVENKYWNKTKGEMADECRNKELLKELMPISMSCSAPGKVRWNKKPQQHCGYCVPCIIRRAAMQKAFGIDGDKTCYSELKMSEVIKKHDSAVGIQLRSFQVAIVRIKNNPKLANILIHKPGPLELKTNYLNELADVYKRGLFEVEDFIEELIKVETDKIT